jgi:hypothetical protein
MAAVVPIIIILGIFSDIVFFREGSSVRPPSAIFCPYCSFINMESIKLTMYLSVFCHSNNNFFVTKSCVVIAVMHLGNL